MFNIIVHLFKYGLFSKLQFIKTFINQGPSTLREKTNKDLFCNLKYDLYCITQKVPIPPPFSVTHYKTDSFVPNKGLLVHECHL